MLLSAIITYKVKALTNLSKGVKISMLKHTPKSKRIAVLMLVFCFCAVFLLPVGFVIVSTNHAHICSDESHGEICTASGAYMCCSVCIDIYNAKNFISIPITSNNSVFSAFMWILALHSVLRPAFSHAGSSSLVILKVRMNN